MWAMLARSRWTPGTTLSRTGCRVRPGLDMIRQVSDELGSEHIPGDGKNVFAS
jgi:hypothetical protein